MEIDVNDEEIDVEREIDSLESDSFRAMSKTDHALLLNNNNWYFKDNSMLHFLFPSIKINGKVKFNTKMQMASNVLFSIK